MYNANMNKENNKNDKVPLLAIVAELSGNSPEEILSWTKEDWINFANSLAE